MDDTNDNNNALLSLTEQKAIVITPKITGLLSMMGCLWIIIEVVTDKRKLYDSMYHRILLGLSINDLMTSFWAYFLSSWMFPTEPYTNERAGNNIFFNASGNWATCNVQGFMFQLGIATPLYNGALSLYYLLLLRYNWTPKQMARRIEPYLHGFVLTFAFATSIAGYFMTLYNPTIMSWCALTEYPYGCVSSSEQKQQPQNANSVQQCIRGHSKYFARLFQYLFGFGPIWFIIAIVTINMTLVYWTVRNQERKMEHKYKFHGLAKRQQRQQQQQHQEQQEKIASSNNGTSLKLTPEATQSRRTKHNVTKIPTTPHPKKRESERIFTISILYTSSFYATFGFHALLHAFGVFNIKFENAGRRAVLAVVILNNIFLPLQGFYNCLIYLYPRYHRYKEQLKKKRYDEYIKQLKELEQQEDSRNNGKARQHNEKKLRHASTGDAVVASLKSPTSTAPPEQESAIQISRRPDQQGVFGNVTANSNSITKDISDHQNESNYKIPKRQNATWREKTIQFCEDHILLDLECLKETFERGWTRETINDDDYKLGGGEEMSVSSVLSTDDIGYVTPLERNRQRSDSVLVVGTSITFEHHGSILTKDDKVTANHDVTVEEIERGASSDQFRHLSILNDSVARMEADPSTNNNHSTIPHVTNLNVVALDISQTAPHLETNDGTITDDE